MEDRTFSLLNKVFLLAVILIAGVLLFFIGQTVYQYKFLDLQDQNQITVSGEGKVYAKPDVALVSLGVTTQGATVADVTQNNTEKMNAVIAAVKALGIDEKDIKTTNYSLSPNYETKAVSMMYYGTTSARIVGYNLEQDVQVKIRDFTKISDVLSKATAVGSNQIGQLQFTIDDPEQFKDQARADAIAQAKDKAKSIASASGIKLGKIINVYENYYPIAYSESLKATGMGGASSVSSPDIQPGQQEISITVNLTYQVK